MRTPVGWKEVLLGDLLAFSNGINAGKSAYGSGVPFANVLEVITNEALREEDIPGRVTLPQKMVDRYRVQHGDLLFNRTSETQDDVGLASVYTGERPIVFGGFVFRGRRRTTDFDFGYAKFVLRGSHVREQIISRGQGGVRANLGQRDLKLVSVMLPPVEEQRVIAEAIDGAAGQISLLGRLIAKKRAVKQGMMQQLLTGRTRLPGFDEPWQRRPVAEMGEVLAGKALNAGGVGSRRPYLRTKNVLDGRIDVVDVLHMPMTDAEFERFRLAPGDVLLNEGQSLELVGRCSIYRGEFGAPVAMQNQLLRFRAFSQTSPEFAAHMFRNCQQSGKFASISTKTTSIAHLGSSRLSGLQLSWPTRLSEQQAIAAVLTDADAEISALEARLAKARAVKQGMMQQLLTGKIRLPITDCPTEDLTS